MTRIEYLVAHPYEVEKSDIPLLKKEVEKYPYFYTLRALLLYGLKKENHPSFEDYLNKTSIHSSNRADLYHYINSEKITKTVSSTENNSTIVDIPKDIEAEEIIANDFSDETILEDDTTTETNDLVEENGIEAITVDEEIVEEQIQENSIETEDLINHNSISETIEEEDIVDEMIENDTEESELRTDHVVDIISDDELNEVADITNEVVESSTFEAKKASEFDIENAILKTSEIETIKDKTEIKKTVLDEPLVEDIHEEKNSIEIIDESKQEESIVPEEENISTDQTFSFSDWLKKSPAQKDQQTIDAEQENTEREIKYKLIDDFLEKNPKIVPMKKTDITPVHQSSNFVQNGDEYSDLMTETLAQIYIEQKKYDKAIKAYKILILKYPEKNSLFANRIKEIENLKNSK